RKYDPELAFRPTGRSIGAVISIALVAMSAYHFYAAGFGLIRELLHRGIHLSFVLGLVFLLFAWRRSISTEMPAPVWHRMGGVSVVDLILAVLAVAASLYLPLLPPEVISRRVGNPSDFDVVMGTALLVLTLEATRRSVGPTLPVIAMVFVAFALFGPWAPGALKHGGVAWE
ncbi:MAG: TRAP transporter permease, partial [Roseovarius sp.]|nr:TRAP transporter permease [Roseovarius sp.]